MQQRTQSLIAFSFSSCVHLAVCLSLALILITGKGHFAQRMQLAVASNEDAEELTELDFTVDYPLEKLELTDSLVSPASTATEVSLDFAPTNASSDSGRSLSAIVSEVARAAKTGFENAVETKSKSGASFFGAQADGNRFVFVIDSSGSMRGPRWEALCKELIRAIKSLSPDQDFFVISFDAIAHPMFASAPPKGKFLKSVDKNVKRVQNWLLSIDHGRNTLPAAAVGMAMKLEPDAIFLLSDGEIRDSTVEDLNIWNRRQDEEGNIKAIIPIHTVLLHSLIGYATLETIARENGGTFTPVQPR